MTLDDVAGDAHCAFLSRALLAARANRSWPDLRVLSSFVAAASPSLHQGAGPSVDVDDATGLLPYETWARLTADRAVAVDVTAGSLAIAGGTRAYRDALRTLQKPRLAELDVAVRNEDKKVRHVHVVLDKIEADGSLVRLAADITLAKSGKNDERALRTLLFPMAQLPVELTLVRLLAAPGVVDVERVTRGAVDVCASAPSGVFPSGTAADIASDIAKKTGGSVLALSFSTCALDVAGGDDDPFPHDTTPLAELARAHLGGTDRALPHRVFRERKLVTTKSAHAHAQELVARAGKRSVVYVVDDMVQRSAT